MNFERSIKIYAMQTFVSSKQASERASGKQQRCVNYKNCSFAKDRKKSEVKCTADVAKLLV